MVHYSANKTTKNKLKAIIEKRIKDSVKHMWKQAKHCYELRILTSIQD